MMRVYYFYYNKNQGCINTVKLKVNPPSLHMEIVAKGSLGRDPVDPEWLIWKAS